VGGGFSKCSSGNRRYAGGPGGGASRGGGGGLWGPKKRGPDRWEKLCFFYRGGILSAIPRGLSERGPAPRRAFSSKEGAEKKKNLRQGAPPGFFFFFFAIRGTISAAQVTLQFREKFGAGAKKKGGGASASDIFFSGRNSMASLRWVLGGPQETKTFFGGGGGAGRVGRGTGIGGLFGAGRGLIGEFSGAPGGPAGNFPRGSGGRKLGVLGAPG